jgi:hypothetical protein
MAISVEEGEKSGDAIAQSAFRNAYFRVFEVIARPMP